MPDKIEKFRRKLDNKRRAALDDILSRIQSGDFSGADVKKLKGEANRYRIRKGGIRVQFSLNTDGEAVEIEVDWLTDTTYR